VAETTVRGQVGDKEIALSAGKLALLADGAVTTTVGGTQVLTTATARREVREGQSFFPLTVDVEERMYSVGRIPGSFFRREGRATEKATLTARLIDRPLRPSFPDGFRSETHVVATVMSADLINPYDVLALNGASAALTVSPIPFLGPLGAVRLALSHGEWIPFPTYEELEESVFEIVVAGKRNGAGGIDIAMVEAGATENGYRLVRDGQQPSDEETVARGLEEAKEYISTMIDLQVELAAQMGRGAKEEFPLVEDYGTELYDRVAAAATPKLEGMGVVADKHERQNAEQAIRDDVLTELGLTEED
jgi:polyribonucleotide nucleotidyltransferase